jgi:hypothetical protein
MPSTHYFLFVLLATFLDDQWRVWGTMIASAAAWWLFSDTPLPPQSRPLPRGVHPGGRHRRGPEGAALSDGRGRSPPQRAGPPETQAEHETGETRSRTGKTRRVPLSGSPGLCCAEGSLFVLAIFALAVGTSFSRCHQGRGQKRKHNERSTPPRRDRCLF